MFVPKVCSRIQPPYIEGVRLTSVGDNSVRRRTSRHRTLRRERGRCSIPYRLRTSMAALFMVALSMAGSVSVVTAQTSARRGQATWVGENGKLRFSEKRRVSLDESIETLDDVTSVVGKNDGSLVVVSKGLAAVVQYDAAGNQTGKIGRWGEGPYEYVAPSVARMDGDDLVVYDAGTLKFIVYDKAGNGKDEWKGFTRSITDFDLSDEAIVAFVGGSHDHYMARIGRETRDTLYFAEANLLRSGLMTYEGNGRMGLREQKAYYMYPDEAAVREYDLLSRRERTIRVPDELSF